jgi:hypothetical protein
MRRIAFTIVLNGMPFIKRQATILPRVFDEWHIIEGATLPLLDTAWCQNINNEFYSEDKLSIDGTTEFIDSIADGNKIFVHRKLDFYNGKTEMCNMIQDRMQDCILMQFDVDEIWDVVTLNSVLSFAEENEGFDGMLFRCNYYVGPNLITHGDNSYGNNSGEWCRLWKINDKTEWVSHEPPRIRGLTDFLSRKYTDEKGWNFNHYAYILEDQVRFKENFYGYTDAVQSWKKLQLHNTYPVRLGDFLPWVRDSASVIKI